MKPFRSTVVWRVPRHGTPNMVTQDALRPPGPTWLQELTRLTLTPYLVTPTVSGHRHRMVMDEKITTTYLSPAWMAASPTEAAHIPCHISEDRF